MSKFVRDSRGLRERLNDLLSWEVLLLNKLYTTSEFNHLDPIFHQDKPDYSHVQRLTLQALKKWKKNVYSRYLITNYTNSLANYKYGLSDAVKDIPDEFI